MGREYVVFLAQTHPNFRLAELEALADLHGIKVDLSNHNDETPFLIVSLESEEDAAKWLKRAVLAKGVYELWGMGATEEEMHEDVKRRSANDWHKYKTNSFKFDIVGYQGKRSNSEKIKMIERFKYVEFDGPIRMKNPDEIFTVLEHYIPIDDNHAAETPSYYYFGRQISLTARSTGVLEQYDLRKRKYIGTTTFEAELSLVSCNLGHVKAGQIMYDPFVGTGSFLVAGAYFGALTTGSDIDGRLIRGKGSQNTIKSNFKQYKNPLLFLDVLTMDFTHNAFRSNLKFDSIVCDPPYGVREGLKVLGAKNPSKFEGKEDVEIEGEKAFLRKDYIPTKKPYELDSLLYDLLEFASERLPINGRLSFWMPTNNDEFQPNIIPQHKNLELKYHLEQQFNKWSRRLLVYINRGEGYNGIDNKDSVTIPEFRKKYFNRE